MNVLDDIIESAVDDKIAIGTLLRKCLVLESLKPNPAFKAWLDKELDGYGNADELPDYREQHVQSHGIFRGMVVQMNDHPIATYVMSEKDRKLIEKVRLTQSAQSYESGPSGVDAAIPWPPHLTTKYQTKFFKGEDPVLLRAWQSIPGSVIVDLLQTVRNRVLRFALDVKAQQAGDDVKGLSSEHLDRSVQMHILRGKAFDWS